MPDFPKIEVTDESQFSKICIESKWVKKPAVKVPPGSIVEIVNSSRQSLGMGFYNGHSRTALRKLSSEVLTDPDTFIQNKIDLAIESREKTLALSKNSNAFRLLNSEGDGLSGLIVDKFNNVIVIEYYSAAMFRVRKKIEESLLKNYPNSTLYFYAEKRIQKQESFDLWEREIPSPVTIVENGVKFEVHPGTKHKTGFFLDQRENRKALSEVSAGKTVLDLCCHSGGFSVYAMTLGGAKSSLGVDYDAEAIEIAKKNAVLNGIASEFQVGDIFEWFKENERKEAYDVVVLDPPRQTRSAEEVPLALRRYFKMNTEAMRKLKPKGLLVSCSCTGRVSEAQFVEVVTEAARSLNRKLKILRVTGAGSDHPWTKEHLAGKYLKVLWAEMEN